jgi:uncharacterized membrane protein YdfJ with MMPL/SSD domain
VIVLYSSSEMTVDDPAFRRAVTDTLDALPLGVVTEVLTCYSTGSPDLVSVDHRSTYAVLQLSESDESARPAQLDVITQQLDAPGLTEQIGGLAAVNRDMSNQVSTDIGRAEALSLPALFVLLVLLLGGLAAASLPLLIGGLAILGAFTALRVITLFTGVPVFAINIVTLLRLGLAIDYGLFMVNRFREDLRRGNHTSVALRRTMATAGRTVALSGVTVAVALSGLLLFPQAFLRSMGFGGMAAVLIAMIGALTVLPAMLAVLGQRVDALSVRPIVRRLAPWTARPKPVGVRSMWFRIAHSVMRRPLVYALGIVTILLVLGSPFLRITFGGIDEQALPAGTESRVVAETLERDFAGAASHPAEIAVNFSGTADPEAQQAGLADYVQELRALDGVEDAVVTGAVPTSPGSGCHTAAIPCRPPREPLSRASGRCRHRQERLLCSVARPRSWSTSWTASARSCPGWDSWWLP